MTNYALARRARSQLEYIYRFSEKRWGTAQADRYVRILFAAFERIGDGTMRSRPFPPDFGVTGQFCACQSHFIYWRKQRSGRTEIVAVVHQRMLQSQQVRLAFGFPV